MLGTTLDDLERASLTLLDKAVEYYKPAKVYALFSGGTDSTAAAILASQHPSFSGCLHLDTETGVPETQHHVRSVAGERGWDLVVEPPRTTSYEALVNHWGFPGSAGHGMAYAHLKDRALSRLTAKKRSGGVTLLVSGARAEESKRRMGHGSLITETAARPYQVWVNPLWGWTKAATEDYAKRHNVAKNPASKKLGMSGECLCGAMARPGELDLIRRYYPGKAEYIDWLSRKAGERGLWDKWGINPPPKIKSWPNSPELPGEAIACSGCIERAA